MPAHYLSLSSSAWTTKIRSTKSPTKFRRRSLQYLQHCGCDSVLYNEFQEPLKDFLSCSATAFDGNCIFWTCRRPDLEPEIWSRNRRRDIGPPQLLLVVATIPRRRALRASWRALRAQSQNLRRALRALGRQGGRASLPGLSGLPQPGCWLAWRVGSMLSASRSWASFPAQIALRCGNAAHELTSERFAHRAGPGPKPGESQPRPGQAWQGQQDTAGPGGPACPQGRPTLKIWMCARLGFEPENPA